MSDVDVYEDGEREEFPPDEFEAEEEPGEGGPTGEIQSDDEDGASKEKKVKRAGAAKRIVKNPQVKLDDMKLCGQRGLPLLPKTFRDVKFKGKGHERRDLDLYLYKMEHWAHRMFPKMVFDEVIERCDRLYKTKKLVKTTLIHMRNGDNLLDEDIAREGGSDDDDDDDVAREGDFDDDAAILSSTVRLNEDAILTPSVTTPAPEPTPVVLSDEVKERIERNKRMAMEKRLARLKALEQESETSPSNSEDTVPGASHQLPPVVPENSESHSAPRDEGALVDATDQNSAEKPDPPVTHNQLDEEELLRLINS